MVILKHKKMSIEGQNSFIGKLQAHLMVSQFTFRKSDFPSSCKCGYQASAVPEDVKEGHFAVLAAKTEKPQRFVVELRLLNNPAFLSLLKRAEEEYGFEQKGVLAVPCQPEELQRILLLDVGEHNAHNRWKDDQKC